VGRFELPASTSRT